MILSNKIFLHKKKRGEGKRGEGGKSGKYNVLLSTDGISIIIRRGNGERGKWNGDKGRGEGIYIPYKLNMCVKCGDRGCTRSRIHSPESDFKPSKERLIYSYTICIQLSKKNIDGLPNKEYL